MANKNEKKYRVIKILNYIFQSLKLEEVRASTWINEFIKNHAGELRGIECA
jgi:hypothetical protein